MLYAQFTLQILRTYSIRRTYDVHKNTRYLILYVRATRCVLLETFTKHTCVSHVPIFGNSRRLNQRFPNCVPRSFRVPYANICKGAANQYCTTRRTAPFSVFFFSKNTVPKFWGSTEYNVAFLRGSADTQLWEPLI